MASQSKPKTLLTPVHTDGSAGKLFREKRREELLTVWVLNTHISYTDDCDGQTHCHNCDKCGKLPRGCSEVDKVFRVGLGMLVLAYWPNLNALTPQPYQNLKCPFFAMNPEVCSL